MDVTANHTLFDPHPETIQDFHVFRVGIFLADVCTSWSDPEEVAIALDLIHPPGSGHRWRLHTKTVGGNSYPQDCPVRTGRYHYLFSVELIQGKPCPTSNNSDSPSPTNGSP